MSMDCGFRVETTTFMDPSKNNYFSNDFLPPPTPKPPKSRGKRKVATKPPLPPNPAGYFVLPLEMNVGSASPTRDVQEPPTKLPSGIVVTTMATLPAPLPSSSVQQEGVNASHSSSIHIVSESSCREILGRCYVLPLGDMQLPAAISSIPMPIHVPYTYICKKRYEIMLCNRNNTPLWTRTVLMKKALFDEQELGRIRIDDYHPEKGVGEVLRLMKRHFRVFNAVSNEDSETPPDENDYVVGHMLASNYFKHDRQAFSTANCTIENSKLNCGVGAAIEKEVMRLALHYDFVVVMKGTIRLFQKVGNLLHSTERFTSGPKQVAIPQCYWKAVACCEIQNNDKFHFDIKSWILENKNPPPGATAEDYVGSLRQVYKDLKAPIFKEFFPYTRRYNGKPTTEVELNKLYTD